MTLQILLSACSSQQDLCSEVSGRSPDDTAAGGLGDVMGALPKALARRGHRVMVVAPRYQNYEEGWETGVRIQLSVGGSTVEVRVQGHDFDSDLTTGKLIVNASRAWGQHYPKGVQIRGAGIGQIYITRCNHGAAKCRLLSVCPPYCCTRQQRSSALCSLPLGCLSSTKVAPYSAGGLLLRLQYSKPNRNFVSKIPGRIT